MARGNQRDKARIAGEKKKDEMAKRQGNGMSGSQMQHAKETNAELMRQKQAASDARKAAEGKK
ncbi:hypothetical protein DER45DRAFT_619618 [Fusarium avenaceum]|nr:hypothetical protein DER45DRAFT_619618 [Fusarium avenaceum]